MVRLLLKVRRVLWSPFRWLGDKVLTPLVEALRKKLDGQKNLKEDLRKIGLVFIGMGLAGPVINEKLAALPFLFIGLILWIAGLLEDVPKE